MSPKSVNKEALDYLGVGFDLPLHSVKDEINVHLEKPCKLKQAKTEQADMGDVLHSWRQRKQLLSLLDGKIEQLVEVRQKSFSFVLENVDLRVLASHMTSDYQNIDCHWCNQNAYWDQINPTHDGPIADPQKVPKDQKALLNDFLVLIDRVLDENLSAFEIFKMLCPSRNNGIQIF